jgi:hypothetical protein
MRSFKAVDAAETRGDADATATVKAEGDGNEAGSDGVGGAAGGATGVVVFVERVAGSAKGGVVVCSICRLVSDSKGQFREEID